MRARQIRYYYCEKSIGAATAPRCVGVIRKSRAQLQFDRSKSIYIEIIRARPALNEPFSRVDELLRDPRALWIFFKGCSEKIRFCNAHKTGTFCYAEI